MERLRTEMRMLLTVSSLTKYSAEMKGSGEDCQRDHRVFLWLLFYGVYLFVDLVWIDFLSPPVRRLSEIPQA